MEQWANIINSALLGTGKKVADAGTLSGVLQQAADNISVATANDREEHFLQLASLIYNFRQSGTQPVNANAAPLAVCRPETKPYCSPAANRVLQQVLDTDSIQLLQLWLEYCTQKGFLMQPDILPVMLDRGWRNKSLRTFIAAAGGYRAEWLGQLNPDWNFSRVAESLEERWQNGATAQRVEALKELRASDPPAARSWLQQTWAKESASVRAELLSVFGRPADPEDLEWLEYLLNDKSKQVRETVVQLLKKIPGSSLHELYWQALESSVQVDADGNIHLSLPENINEDVFRSGIEKLSSDSKISDETHILYQLFSFVHPSRWEKYFGKNTREMIRLFLFDKVLQPFVPALVLAITRFEDKQRALSFMLESSTFYIELIPILPPDLQQHFAEVSFDQDPAAVIGYVTAIEDEWSLPLCERILKYAATQPYSYNQQFMSNVIRQIPVGIMAKLDEIAPTASYHTGYWNNIKVHLGKLLQAKSQIQSL
jgi:hypothetical protein